ncbi:MAG: TetR/AcrR family transcriptional regulator [Actinomycetota bacterium]
MRASDGRVPGRRGLATRDRLLECTGDRLEKVSYRDLKVIDVARCAGTSPATFYQYFPDVEAAVLELARALSDEGKALVELIKDSTWKGKAGEATALALSDAFLDLWERHRAILRVVDLATAEGELHFQNIRTHLLNEITLALREGIASSRAQGRLPADLDPMAQAATVVSMLAHVAAHRYGFEFWGIRLDGLRRSMARMVYAGVAGAK